MSLSKKTLLGAVAMAAVCLVLTAPSASADSTNLQRVIDVAPGATVDIAENCPSSSPYMQRTGFRVQYGPGADGMKSVRRNDERDGWVVRATNSGTEPATVSVTYICSTAPTTIGKWNAVIVRSSDKKPLRAPVGCPSNYPLFESLEYEQRGLTQSFTSYEVDAGAGVQRLVPEPNGQVYITFSSSYPFLTNPPVNEYIKFNYTCSR
ncbi:hypothetical protein [Streptosporangium sp. NPDC051022]|uniref:hypothetical protein n=1 Tax=Streptosporangium sp. NPDC051022 TaxID=3155752 RepID=UPI00343304A1